MDVKPVPKTVDDYLKALSPPVRSALKKIRKAIRTAAPNAEEVISYQIPTYKYRGALVHFAAFKDHCSFFVVNKNIIKLFAKELEAYETSGTTIRFMPATALPGTLVQKIVRIRLKENEEAGGKKTFSARKWKGK